MVNMKEIEIIIDKDGNVKIDVKNGEGSTCLDETAELEEKLGIVTSREKKPEFFSNVQNNTLKKQYTR